jgi:replicative DNA helicase
LKQLAQEYQVPIVVASQLNRTSGMQKDIGVESLSQSDAIGQDADGVIMTQKITPSVRKFSLPKYRHGPDGYHWYCEFKPHKGIFKEVNGERVEELKDIDSLRED